MNSADKSRPFIFQLLDGSLEVKEGKAAKKPGMLITNAPTEAKAEAKAETKPAAKPVESASAQSKKDKGLELLNFKFDEKPNTREEKDEDAKGFFDSDRNARKLGDKSKGKEALPKLGEKHSPISKPKPAMNPVDLQDDEEDDIDNDAFLRECHGMDFTIDSSYFDQFDHIEDAEKP